MKPKPNSTTSYYPHPRTPPILLQHARELRHPQTPAEQKLWSRLRNRQLNGFKFRRQHPIERFIIDFYCDEAKLCIEIDGDSHAEQIEYDQARAAYLNELSYTVMRFTNREVFNQARRCCNTSPRNVSGLLRMRRFDSEDETALQSSGVNE